MWCCARATLAVLLGPTGMGWRSGSTQQEVQFAVVRRFVVNDYGLPVMLVIQPLF